MDAHKDSALRQKYSSALMSNHKWKKLFTAMAEVSPELCGIEYHFTDTEVVYYGSAPTTSQVWDTAIDDPVQGAGGPVEYKHIESILIPYVHKFRAYEKAPYTIKDQNIGIFLEALSKLGEFPIKKTEDFIIIYGYK